MTQAESSAATAIKTEDTASKRSSTQAKPATPKKPKVKKEVDDTQELPEDYVDELGLDPRIDLADFDLPGGPVSSQRKDERMGRWKKVELWIEQEEAEEVLPDDDEEATSQQLVRVKVEESVEDVNPPPVETIMAPQVMAIESDEDLEEKMRHAAKSRRRRRRRELKGKTQEEKEEMAREEVDLEILRKVFLASDGSDVFPDFNQMLTT